MQVVLHAGAHVTDDDRLVKCLVANQGDLSEQGTSVPRPSAYRKLIRDIMQTAQESGLAEDSRDVLLDAIAHDDGADRLILSNPGFFGTPKMAASAGVFYSAAESRLNIFSEIFANDQIELFMAICNPATFLPAILDQTPFDNVADYLRGVDPGELRWSEMIARLRNAFPQMPITIWYNEDLPLIWAEIVRELAGLDPTTGFEGEYALLSEIMSDTGMARFEAYLEAHPGMTEVQKRRVIAAFLDKFAQEDAIEQELDIPGWTEEIVARLTEIYDEDLYQIQRIPGINLITP